MAVLCRAVAPQSETLLVTGDHPGYLAVLTRCAYGPSVTSEERDRLLRTLFPELVTTMEQTESTLRVLREAADLHRHGEPHNALIVLRSLLGDVERKA